MNVLLIARAEIVCLIILSFIVLCSRMYKMGKDQADFLRICFFAIGHVIFDLITVITVNSESCPEIINYICHLIFYFFALLFAYEFFCYTVLLCSTKKNHKAACRFGLLPIALYALALPFLKMVYLSGNGTKYSFGMAAFVGYGVALLFFITSVVIVIINLSKVKLYIKATLLPMLISSIAAMILQIAVPELLFTGCAVTIITVGFFFSLENPIAVLRHKVMIDTMTGVKSRHSYDSDVERIESKFVKNNNYGIVFCDINDLKSVNDKHGHLEGDNYIANVARILLENLKGADTVYRIGGDEFVAIYQNKDINVLSKEIKTAKKACEEQSQNQDYPISVAIGYAVSDKTTGSLRDVISAADRMMYTDKAKLKLKQVYMLSENGQLDISALTDRVFDVFADTDKDRFLFVTNLTTNVTRWSHSAAVYFGLDCEFIPDCFNVWRKRIHPDDRDRFDDDISAVFAGKRESHELKYRIMNSDGQYVYCCCTGKVMHGKGNEPDLFAGTIFALEK